MCQVIAGGRGHVRGCGGGEEVEEGRAEGMASGIRNSVSTRRENTLTRQVKVHTPRGQKERLKV